MRIYKVYYRDGKINIFYSLTALWQSEPDLSRKTITDMIHTGMGSKNIDHIEYSMIKEKQNYILSHKGNYVVYKSLTMVKRVTRFTNDTIVHLLESGDELNGYTIDIL